MPSKINLDKVEQVTITRSFSKKIQLEQFEPVEVFSSVQAIMRPEVTEGDVQVLSAQLHDVVVREVERDMESYIRNTKPPF